MTVPAPEPADLERLEALLTTLGATPDELAHARRNQELSALALDLTLRAGSPSIDLVGAAARLGVEPEEVARTWQALGFPDPTQHRATERFADAQRVISTVASEWLGDEVALGIARVVGTSTARLADAIVDAFRMAWEVPELTAGARYSDVVEGYLAITRDTLPGFKAFVGEVLQAHLVRAAGSAWMPGDDATSTRKELAIGFVDLVGYTALTRTLNPRELASLLNRFDQTVADGLAKHGARAVKTIGDGVMFAADTAAAGCDAALALAAAFGGDSDLPPVRVGLAQGAVLALYGDYFGDVVNLAARLVALANPGTVVVSEAVARTARTSHRKLERLPSQALKGFGAPSDVFRLLG